MPWQFEPKKDVCMSTKTAMSPSTGAINRWFPNGAIHLTAMSGILPQGKRGTRRTETSKYPVEETSYEIP